MKIIFKMFLMFSFMLCSYSQDFIVPENNEDPSSRVQYETKRLINPSTKKIPINIRNKELGYVKSSKSRLQPSLKSTYNAIQWNPRGPYNVGGRTRALAIDVEDENIILAGGVSGGMWKSRDGGANWVKVSGTSDLHSVTAIAQDTRPGHTRTWYYSTGEFSGNSASTEGGFYLGDGIFKSTDNGNTWCQLKSTVFSSPESFDKNFEICWNIKVDPQNGYVYAAIYGGIIVSINGGDTWHLIHGRESEPSSKYTDIDISSTGTVYATLSYESSSSKGIYRMNEDGKFVNIIPSGFGEEYKRIVICICPSNENIIYFLAETPNSGISTTGGEWISLWKYTYISGDGSGSGGIWQDLSNNLPRNSNGHAPFDSQNSYNLVVKAKSDDENVVFIGGTNLYRSTDGFSSSLNVTQIGGYRVSGFPNWYENHHPDIHAMVFYPSGANKMLCSHDGGISYTDNSMANISPTQPVEWIDLNPGYITSQAYAIGINMNDTSDYRIICGFQDNGTYSSESASFFDYWMREYLNDGGYCAYTEASGDNEYRYYSMQRGTVYQAVYNSSGNRLSSRYINPSATNTLYITPFLIDPTNTDRMYYAGGNKIFRCNDLSQVSLQWSELNNSETNEQISALGISTQGNDVLYYGTTDGEVYKINSPSAGDPIKTDIYSNKDLPSGAYVSCIAVDLEDHNRVFLTYSNYQVKSIFYSYDGGTSWENISGNLEENNDGSGSGPSVRWIDLVQLRSGKYIYLVGTSTGLYSTYKLDGNNTQWLQEGLGSIGNVVVDMLRTRYDGFVAVATHGNGMYSAKINLDYEVPDNYYSQYTFSLYPNPNDGQFSIDYSSFAGEKINLGVYDYSGREIWSEYIEKSEYEIQIPIDLPVYQEGLYILKFHTNKRSIVKKIFIYK